MGNETTPIPSGAEGLKELVLLAGRASGVEIITINAPAGLEGVPATIPAAIRHGTTPEVIGVEKLFEAYRDHPRFKTGTARALTLDSFILLVRRHMTEHSAVFADTNWREPSFQAVIDYHQVIDTGGGRTVPGDAANLKHRITYSFPLSEEWKAWVDVNGGRLSQGDFAAFIEDHIADLSSPTDAEKIALERDFQTTVATPADMLRLSRGLQVNVNSVAKSAVTLQSGEGQITWSEEHVDESGKPLKVPGMFLLNVAPFFMGEKARIPVKLRYRVSGGKVEWTFVIYRPDIHVTERVRTDLDHVAQHTDLPTYEGSPES